MDIYFICKKYIDKIDIYFIYCFQQGDDKMTKTQEEIQITHNALACRIFAEFITAKKNNDVERVKSLREMLANRIAEIDRFFPVQGN